MTAPSYGDEYGTPAIELPGDDTPVAVAAEMYARAGLNPIPVYGLRGGRCTCGDKCAKPGKHPVGEGWQKHPVPDVDGVRDRFRGHAGNIGLAGGNGIVFIDVDGASGWESLSKMVGDIPDTLRSISGSGNGGHLVFRLASWHNEAEIPNRVGVMPGIDVRCRGGQIVAAPSMHASGNRYRWVNNAQPAVLPDAIYERIRRPKASAAPVIPITRGRDTFKRVRAYVAKMDPAIQGSNGSGACFEVANVVTHNGLTSDEEWSIMLEYNQRCDPPWSERELRHKLESARNAENPRVLEDRPRSVPTRPATESDRHGSGGGGAPPSGDDDSWKAMCIWEQTRGGATRLKKTVENAIVILQFDPAWRGRIFYDQFTQRDKVSGPPWDDHLLSGGTAETAQWSDSDTTRLQAWLVRHHGLQLSIDDLDRAVRVVAERKTIHSARDWMHTLEWDGVSRLDAWLIRYMGAQPSDYARAVGRWWLISAVARCYEPGCKADHVLILEGSQGIGKSSALRVLAGDEWFSDTPIDIGSKDALLALRGKLIVELGELDSLKRTDADRAKAFFTGQIDDVRDPYGKRMMAVPRSCVFAGSVNHMEYLKDDTGGRRYWPVRCSSADLAALRADRDQLWAEAVVAYRDGAAWYPETSADAHMCAVEQEQRRQAHPWEERIDQWIHANEVTETTVSDVLSRAIEAKAERWTQADKARVTAILRSIGFVDKRVRMPNGQQVRAFVRKEGRLVE